MATLYADDATFASQPFRPLAIGGEGARAYAAWAFEEEVEVRCWFSEPHVVGSQRDYWNTAHGPIQPLHGWTRDPFASLP